MSGQILQVCEGVQPRAGPETEALERRLHGRPEAAAGSDRPGAREHLDLFEDPVPDVLPAEGGPQRGGEQQEAVRPLLEGAQGLLPAAERARVNHEQQTRGKQSLVAERGGRTET